MRILFIVVVIANIVVFLYGKGVFMPEPEQWGRTAALPSAYNAEYVAIGSPQAKWLPSSKNSSSSSGQK
ncbi:MAG TPA: hypothetical protein VK032_09570 [Burkholderiaceae bacterium]|nr:hypothetical protein [Burkholderiaceae bacterium]